MAAAAAKAKVDVEVKEKEAPHFVRAEFKLFEAANAMWKALAPEGMTIEDLKSPSCWSSNIGNWHDGDLIWVVSRGAWWAQVMIADVTGGACLPVVVASGELPKVIPVGRFNLPDGFEVFKYEGRWGVRWIETRQQLIEPSHIDPRDAALNALQHPRFTQV